MDDEPEIDELLSPLTPSTIAEYGAAVMVLSAFILPEAAGSMKIDLSDNQGLRVTIRRIAKRARKARKLDA